MATSYSQEYAYVSNSSAECEDCGVGPEYEKVLIKDAYPDGFTCANCGDDFLP